MHRGKEIEVANAPYYTDIFLKHFFSYFLKMKKIILSEHMFLVLFLQFHDTIFGDENGKSYQYRLSGTIRKRKWQLKPRKKIGKMTRRVRNLFSGSWCNR